MNRLVHEENYQQSKRYSYTYDNGGNITNRKTYQLVSGVVSELLNTDTYAYSSAWKDQLISYNGQTITYDALGNPTTYKGKTLTWTNVRRLASYGNNTFAYNANGIRYKKNNTVYTLEGNRILRESDGAKTITYYYGTNGVVGFNYNDEDYYYRKNLQGDVIAIYTASGALVAEYQYDAWGKILSVTNYNGSEVGSINPFRYRSYYYDTETGLYYLQTRYYDPEIGRFLNSDDLEYLGSGAELSNYNLFAYCNNNPVAGYDPTGTFKIKNPYSELSWFGEIHREVQKHIAEKYTELGFNVKLEYKFMDVYIFDTDTFYEVKPVSHQYHPWTAEAQVQRYKLLSPKSKESEIPMNNSFYTKPAGKFGHSYKVTYWSNPQYPWLIHYVFERESTEEEEKAIKYVAVGVSILGTLGFIAKGLTGNIPVGGGLRAPAFSGGGGIRWSYPLRSAGLI